MLFIFRLSFKSNSVRRKEAAEDNGPPRLIPTGSLSPYLFLVYVYV